MNGPQRRRAAVVGTGLIGGSIAAGLRHAGWTVWGIDRDPARQDAAVAAGIVHHAGRPDIEVDVCVVATPVGHVADAAVDALGWSRFVTDVGSVKAPIVDAVAHPRFVGGHPMAGSEQEGIAGADPTLFEGATWVLTPTPDTDSDAYTTVRTMITELGAEVVSVPPADHDRLVAVVSHVPHLTAATLMGLASERADEHRALLRLAAGGFRDMTRIAAGHPGIWPDICAANRAAIGEVLDGLIADLGRVRDLVADADRDGLLSVLEGARTARTNLPVRGLDPGPLSVLRVPVPDRPGVLAEVTTLAAELDVNICDIEMAHSAEGGGVIIMIVPSATVERLVGGLLARRYRASVHPLEPVVTDTGSGS